MGGFIAEICRGKNTNPKPSNLSMCLSKFNHA